jgi:hypothetical protein
VRASGAMELSQVGQLVGAFIGGGITRSLIDYLLKERGARRAGLRPKDLERIEAVREYVRAIDDARRIPLDRRDETPRDTIDRLGQMAVVRDNGSTQEVVFQLDDRRLTRVWNRFEDAGWRALGALHQRNVLFTDALEAERQLVKLCRKLREQLNRLERRR